MDILQIIAKQAVMIAVFMAVGFAANKLRILDQEANNRITNLLVKVVSPIMIFVSYQRDYDAQLLKNLGFAVLLAAAAFLLSVALGYLLLPGKDPDHGAIERFAAVYPNLGFMGIPLVNAVLGSEGVFYATASMTVFDLFCWTHGVLLMSGSCSFRELLRKLLSPSIVSVVVSLTCFFAAPAAAEHPAFAAREHFRRQYAARHDGRRVDDCADQPASGLCQAQALLCLVLPAAAHPGGDLAAVPLFAGQHARAHRDSARHVLPVRDLQRCVLHPF